MRLVSLLLLSLVAAACGAQSSGSCSAANCTGCCSAAGVCVAGSANDACGSGGAACANCFSQSRTCVLSFCSSGTGGSGGTGGGSGGGFATGGGSATGGGAATGGGGGSCPTLTVPAVLPSGPWTPYAASGSTVSPATSEARFVNTAGGMAVGVSFALVRRASVPTPTFPFSGAFTTGAGNCVGCARYLVCPGGVLTCGTAGTRTFEAVSGSYTFTRADTNSTTGFIRGTVGPVRLVEWDYQANAAIGGGDCYELAATTFEGQWP